MFCGNCGNKLDDEDIFCPYCGQRVDPIEETGKEAIYQKQEQTNSSKPAEKTFDELNEKLQNKLGIEHEDTITHEYQRLGGWLALFTYCYAVTAILVGIYMVVCLITMISTVSLISGMGLNGSTLAIFCAGGLSLYMCAKMFLFIQNKNTDFLRFYETFAIIAIVIDVGGTLLLLITSGSLMGGYAAYMIPAILSRRLPSLLTTFAGYAVQILYYSKSVRVRTYFGTDEYFNKSIFCKNVVRPTPAVPDVQ